MVKLIKSHLIYEVHERSETSGQTCRLYMLEERKSFISRRAFWSSGSAAALTECGVIGDVCGPVISILQDEFIPQVDSFYSWSTSVVCSDPVIAAWLYPADNIYCRLCISFIIQPQKGARLFDVV